MIALPWRGVSAHLATRSRTWVKNRQGIDGHNVELHSRRIYILPTRFGLLYALIVTTLLISSMNFSNNMGFALTFLLVGIGLVSMHHCHRNLNGLQLKLIDTQSCFAGEHAGFRLRLQNPSTTTRWQLQAGWDRHGTQCLDLYGDASESLILTFESRQRGRLKAPRIGISSVFPLGLFRAWCWVHMDATAIVWPKPVAQAERPPAFDSDTPNQQTQALAGDDLSGVREYQHGDSPRRIDWKALARYGELLVREYQDGSTSNAWLDWEAIDEIDTEIRLTILTRLVLDAHADGLEYGLRLPEGVLNPGNGDAHLHECLNQLALHALVAPSGYASE